MGRSRAADATCLTIPALAWMMDCGAIVQEWKPENVFVTHTHSDHANRVTHIASRHTPPTIHLPHSAVPLMDGYINGHQAMTDNRPLEKLLAAMEHGPPEWQVNRRLKGVDVGDVIELQKGGKEWKNEVVRCNHSVDCVGYAFREARKSLKKQYRGLAGKELGKLRHEGIDINEEELINRFVFMGDTTASIFSEQPELLLFPVVITECSFISPKHKDSAIRTKHTHWDDLKPPLSSYSSAYATLSRKYFSSSGRKTSPATSPLPRPRSRHKALP